MPKKKVIYEFEVMVEKPELFGIKIAEVFSIVETKNGVGADCLRIAKYNPNRDRYDIIDLEDNEYFYRKMTEILKTYGDLDKNLFDKFMMDITIDSI